jgi:protein SCO1/2
LIALTLILAACGSDAPSAPAGIVREPAPDVSSVTLPDESAGGVAFATKAQPGEILLVYFGYTSCPDVCPTTLADVRRALSEMDDERATRVDLAFATVDPDRDDGERLTAYAQTFVPGAHALRTDDPDELRSAADAYGASYEVSTNDNGDIEVAHSAFLYAVDANGRIRLTWPFGTPHEDLTRDMEYLFNEGV